MNPTLNYKSTEDNLGIILLKNKNVSQGLHLVNVLYSTWR